MDKNLLKTVIADQEYYFEQAKGSVKRELPESFRTAPEIVIITGIRRCGKSTLMQQIRAEQSESDYYINFDDERLVSFKVEDFQVLLEVFYELFGVQKTYYFDEIQNVQQWERFIRRLHDTGNKVYITGSNARMLSRELGTHLTGRYLSHQLYPFSFKEFILFKNSLLLDENLYKTNVKATVLSLFDDYFNNGGFPNFVRTGDELALKTLFENILYRDIMVRNNLTNAIEIRELVSYLAGNYARLSTNSELAKIIGIKNPSTIKKYIGFLSDSYLIFQTYKYDYSVSKQILNPKKSYFIDNGLVKRVGFSFSDNLGHLLENLVYIELLRRGKEVFYYNKKQACDFLLVENKLVTHAIQVCYSFYSEKTKKREIDGLLEAMDTFNLTTGLIITNSIEDTIIVEDKHITILPAYKWLLE